MKNIKIAFDFFTSKSESLHNVLTSSFTEGTDAQIKFANSIFSTVLADTQSRCNHIFKNLRVDNYETLENQYNQYQYNSLKSIDMMIDQLLSYKNASDFIKFFKDNRTIKAVLWAIPTLEEYFDNNEIDY